MFDITGFGAVGDGSTNDTAAIQHAIDVCRDAGGGTVLVPAGKTFLTGTLTLCSNLRLQIDGRLISSEDRADFTGGKMQFMIEARGCHNIAVTGLGTIDGRGRLFIAQDRGNIFAMKPWRPRLIGLIDCAGVTFRDVTLRDAALWGLHLAGCRDVVIDGIRIFNDMKIPNCDGIDPDHCRNVRISNCHIEAGDDGIVIKNSREFAEFGPSENITVTGCTVVSNSAALKLGTEGVTDFRNIIFTGCVVSGSSRGLAIQIRDQGDVENVIFSDIVVETRLPDPAWWGKGEPIYVTAVRREGDGPAAAWNPRRKLGRVRNVRFSNILCRSEGGVFVVGSQDVPIEDITLDHVRVGMDKWTEWPGGEHDLRPLGKWPPDALALSAIAPHPTAGIYLDHVRDATLRSCKVTWGKKAPDYFRHALEAHDAPGLVLDRFSGQAAHPGRDAAQFID